MGGEAPRGVFARLPPRGPSRPCEPGLRRAVHEFGLRQPRRVAGEWAEPVPGQLGWGRQHSLGARVADRDMAMRSIWRWRGQLEPVVVCRLGAHNSLAPDGPALEL